MLGRLLRCEVEHATLTAQCRIPPQLARLLSPLYPSMTSHPLAASASAAVPAVHGIDRPVFFLQHEKPESVDAATGSRCNIHEAGFVAALALYLMRQGHTPASLAILTPYAGQAALISRELRAQKEEGQTTLGGAAADVRVSTVAQFEGQEADVVLLSLVRSNEQGRLGLAALPQTVAAALSRAKAACYVVGNAALLRAHSPLWEKVLSQLHEHKVSLGDFLPLQATRDDTGRQALVRSAADFKGVATEFERRK